MKVTDYICTVIIKHPETLHNLRAIVDAVDNNKMEGFEIDRGRINRWAYIEDAHKYFKIILLSDGTFLNAYPDGRYTQQKRKE
jgi:hypothetical protein